MRTNLSTSILLSGILLFSSCGGSGTGKDAKGGDTLAVARIQTMEDTLYARPGVDRKGAQALLDVYLAYAKIHPLDSMTPEYIFRGASIKSTLGDPQGGIELYNRIIRDFPHWRKIADTYYLKAFTIDNGLHRKGEAETAYNEVISRFPDHRFAADSKQMIENLKYSDEELMKKFEAMNANSTQPQAAANK